MASINQLVFDVMEIVRGQQISDDTDISEKQVIYQTNNQRALWLKREQNKPGASIDRMLYYRIRMYCT